MLKVPLLTLFYQTFCIDFLRNICKPEVFWCFQGDQEGTWRKRIKKSKGDQTVDIYSTYNIGNKHIGLSISNAPLTINRNTPDTSKFVTTTSHWKLITDASAKEFARFEESEKLPEKTCVKETVSRKHISSLSILMGELDS